MLLAAAVGWLLWRTGRPPETEALRQETVATPPAQRDAELAGLPSLEEAGPANADGTRSAVAVEPPTSAAPGDARDVEIEPPPDDGIPVRVLRGRTEDPVPFAVVGVAERFNASDAARLERHVHGLALEQELERTGRYFQAGEDGIALVPRPRLYSVVTCDMEGLWGTAELWKGRVQDFEELRLFPSPALLVRVVSDADGTPIAGAQVAIRYVLGREDSETLAVFEADSQGEVRIAGLRQYARNYWAHTEALVVVPAGLFAEELGQRFEPDSPPDRIELALPPLSELEVLVVDADGQPAERPVGVRVGTRVSTLHDRGRTIAAVTENGRVLFEQIGVGLDLALDLEDQHGTIGEPLQAQSGASAGSRVTVTLPLVDERPLVAGTALGPAGGPLAGEELSAVFRRDRYRFQQRASVLTAADGSFELPVRPGTQGEQELFLELTAAARPPRRPTAIQASLRIEGPLPAARYELGRVSLREAPLLAQGQVVDPDGGPIARALVQVRALHPERTGNIFGSCRSDEQGRFELRGTYREPELRLMGSHPSFRSPDHPEVATGSRDVRIELAWAGRIEGSALFDDEWLCDFALAEAIREDDERGAQLKRPGFFAFDSLAPGTWTVRVGMENDIKDGVEVQGVVVRQGETTRDPRLQDIDLRAARHMRFSVVDASADPIEKGAVYYRAAGSEAWSLTAEIENGKADVFTALRELDLYFDAAEHRGQLVPNARDGGRVVLREPLRASFRWSEERPETSGARLVRVSMSRASTDLPRMDPGIFIVGPQDDEVLTIVPAPGRYRIRYDRQVLLHQSWVEQGEPLFDEVTIRDAGGVQPFTLRRPPEVIEFLTRPSEGD